MKAKPESQGPLLGFLGLYGTSGSDGYLGALLITDARGVPQEFRCTHPVKPTMVQKPLYGESLEPYIGVNLCGTRLIESMQQTPSLIIVNRDFLARVRRVTDCPVAFVQKAGETLQIRPQEGQEKTATRTRLDCPTGRFQPIVLSLDPEFEEETEGVVKALQGVFAYLDPTEPFERMRQALDVLAKQDSKYR